MTQRTFLRVTKYVGYTEESITRIELDHGISAGIRWGAIGADMVPTFEEHATRLESRYEIEKWYALDPMERAIIVAVRRIDIAAKNQQSEAEIRESKRNAKRK